MSDQNYQPWREKTTQAPLTQDAADSWRQLLSDSRAAITQLSYLTQDVTSHVECGQKLVNLMKLHQTRVAGQATNLGRTEQRIYDRLFQIEKRLDHLEQQLDAVRPGKTESGPGKPEAADEVFDQMIIQIPGERKLDEGSAVEPSWSGPRTYRDFLEEMRDKAA